MFLGLPLPLQALVLAFLFPPSKYVVVKAEFVPRNFTVDDSDPSIRWSSGWNVSDGNNILDYGGAHHFSNQNDAFAEFTFTGVAAYFLSPLWPYSVQARIMVDGQNPMSIDLRDYSQPFSQDGGPETVTSAVRWSSGDLSNDTHTLNISFDNDGGSYVAVDALIYTVDAEEDPPPTTSSPNNLSQSTTTTATAASQTTSQSNSSNSSAPVIIGVVVAVVLAVIGIIIAFWYTRNRRRLLQRYGRHIGINTSSSGDDEEKINSSSGGVVDSVTPFIPGSQGNDENSRKVQKNGRSIRSSVRRFPIFLRNSKPLPELPPAPPSPSFSTGDGSLVETQKNPNLPRSPTFTRPRPPPVVPVNPKADVKRSGTNSTIASFFPAPMDPKDQVLMRRLSGALSRKSSGKSSNLPAKLIDEEERQRELDATYPIILSTVNEPVRPLVIVPPPRGKSRPQLRINNNPPAPSASSAGTGGKAVSVSPTAPEAHVLPAAEPSPLITIKRPIHDIPESFPSTPGSRSSAISKSSDGSKRRSSGRRHLDREKSRRRLGKTVSSPRGPRFRPQSASRPTSIRGPSLSVPSIAGLQSRLMDGTSAPSIPVTPNTASTTSRRPLPRRPSLSRKPSLSRGPHVLVPVHLIPRLAATSRTTNINTKIAQWQLEQRLVQSRLPPHSPQRSATEGTSTFSSDNSTLMSSLASSLVALFPQVPQQGLSNQSLPSTLNTESGIVASQLLTPSPTIRRPNRNSSKNDSSGSPESQRPEASSAARNHDSSRAQEKSQSDSAVNTPKIEKSTAIQPSAPATITNTPIVTSPVARESIPSNRPLPTPTALAEFPAIAKTGSSVVTSPVSPRRPFPAPLKNLPLSNLALASGIPPPPYSGRRIPNASTSSGNGNEIEKLTYAYHKIPPNNVPHTPSMYSSWSSLKLAAAVQSKLGSNESSLDSTSGKVLNEMLDSYTSRHSVVEQDTIVDSPPTPPPPSSLPEPVPQQDTSVGLSVSGPRYALASKTKSRPPALSIISGSAASSLQDTPPASRGASDRNISQTLELEPSSTPKRVSGTSVRITEAPATPQITPPPPPLPLTPPKSLLQPKPAASLVQPARAPSPSNLGLPANPSPRYLAVNQPLAPASGSSTSSAQNTPPSSRGNSSELDRLSIDLPEIRPLYTPRRTSVASTASNRVLVPPLTLPPPLPVDSNLARPTTAATTTPPRIRTKVWTQEGPTNTRGRALPFPVNSRQRPPNETVTTLSSEQSTQNRTTAS